MQNPSNKSGKTKPQVRVITAPRPFNSLVLLVTRRLGWGGGGGGGGSPRIFGWGWVGWFFTCCIENQLFLVGLVDKLFQPTRNPVEMVENDGYRPL